MSSIEIVENGITDLKTDAVVNAANEGLWEGGGVCGVIFRAAGSKELTAACNKIGHCDTGDAVITPSFGLKDAKYIIHAVGPRWNGGRNDEAKLLYSAYYRSLELAAEHDCRSVGFPLISAGIFGYPVDEAWTVAVSACSDFIKAHPDHQILIRFGVPSEKNRRSGEEALKRYPSSDSGSPDKMSDAEKNEKCRQLPVLTTRTVSFGGGKLPDGTSLLPYPIYDDEVNSWIDSLYALKLTDLNYLENIEKIKDKPIGQLTRDEILTRMTWLVRGERFCDGLIAEWLGNGSLEALCKRLQSIV